MKLINQICLAAKFVGKSLDVDIWLNITHSLIWKLHLIYVKQQTVVCVYISASNFQPITVKLMLLKLSMALWVGSNFILIADKLVRLPRML